MTEVIALSTSELGPDQVVAIRELFDAAWPSDADRFTEEDWSHSVGGVHFLVKEDGVVVAHASVVERELHPGGHRLVSGYVEAVATRPSKQGRGLGSAVMRAANAYIDETFQLGALATGRPAFYERLGWLAWRGPTFVRTDAGLVRTEEDDGAVLIRLTPTSPRLELTAPISCEWRPGDVW
jgi:aminoglycoside 2'-N-acetyltransferase I